MSTPVVNAVSRAIRRATKQPDVVAALIVSTVVRRTKYPLRGGGGKKGAKGFARINRRTGTARVATVRNATMQMGRLFVNAAEAVLLVTTLPLSPV